MVLQMGFPETKFNMPMKKFNIEDSGNRPHSRLLSVKLRRRR